MSIRVIVAFAALSALTLSTAEAQRVPMQIELSGGYGFHFGGGASTREGSVTVDESGSFGFTLDIPVRQDARIEVLWWRQNTQADFQPIAGAPSSSDMAVEYYQLGGLTEFPQGNLIPYGVLTLGTTRLIGKGDLSGDEWRFGGTLGGGVKLGGRSRIGLKLDGRLLWTARNTGSAFWCGAGGCAVGITGHAVAQGLFSASVFVKVGGAR